MLAYVARKFAKVQIFQKTEKTHPKRSEGIRRNVEGVVIDVFENRIEASLFVVEQNFDELFVHG